MVAKYAGNTYYLVRHGEAENNVRNILNSLPERNTYPLTERGREQVGATARLLRSVEVDVIWSSPILRTRETAEIIAHETGRGVNIDGRLCEAYFGVFNGRQQQEFLEKYPEAEMRLAPDPADGVESYVDIRGRVRSFLSSMNESYRGKKIVIVSHSDTLQELYAELFGEPVGAEQGVGHWLPEKGSCLVVTPNGVRSLNLVTQ
ncbi:MAG: histidine phosphatase family protein [Candidatus Moraniibacteriota bacterium]